MKNKTSLLKKSDEQNQSLIKQYKGEITWERIYFIWKETLESFNVATDNIFLEIEANNPELTLGTLYFSWWERNIIMESRRSALNIIESAQSLTLIRKPDFDIGFRSAELDTLKSLWEFRCNPEQIAALLLKASLFSRVESSRATLPVHWPPYIVLEKLSDTIDQIFDSSCTKPFWVKSCTQVIPVFSNDTNFKIDKISALIHYLAIEHCKLLSTYQPIRIVNTPLETDVINGLT